MPANHGVRVKATIYKLVEKALGSPYLFAVPPLSESAKSMK